MRNFFTSIIMLMSLTVFSQDVFMQNGTFNRCESDKLYDSGGGTANYGSNENYVTTICAINPADFIILDFTTFSTQLGQDVLSIYDGPDISSPLIGNYSGGSSFSPGRVSASPANTSGCLTLQFISNATNNGPGFIADILCAEPCQTITASIDSTTPLPNGSGVITIFPGASVDFNGSAIFSDDSSGATYSWNFADGSPIVNGQSVSHVFNNPGTYNVSFTAKDTNPQGCSDTDTIAVLVLQAIVSINNSAYTESLYSPQELIQNVLVSGGCSAVDNFSVQVNGDPGDLQTKSYGYFNKGGAVNFPFEEGIVLSTGRAFAAGNTINGGLVSFDNNDAGDADLEAALGQVNTNDATFIKFNFVPTGDTISFRYLMASEEYDGNTECNYADSFAFLLREVGTTAYTNLAVLPNGTPVSVTNINNSGVCTANPGFFQGYNIGDTNYGGRTIVLTATANVTLGVTYEIKLVVADQGDSIWDSSIFLEAGSFNLGGELGNDITIASGNAQCNGGLITLDTQAPNATHIWYKDGIEISGEINSILNVIESGIYSVDVIFSGTCQSNDSIEVEFYPEIIINSVPDLFLCNPGAAPYNFDLTQNNLPIFGSITDTSNYRITYHELQTDADADINNIPNPDLYSGFDGQVVFARLEYLNSGCYQTESFTLNIIARPTINSVSDLLVCDDFSNDGLAPFDLETQTAIILGSQPSSNFNASYYASFADADANVNNLVSPYINIINSQPIYVRLENIGNVNCTSVSLNPVFYLIVNDRPFANQPDDIFICDNPSNDGFGQFNLLQQSLAILGSQLPSNYSIFYYESQTEAEMASNPILNSANYTNTSNPQTVFVRVFENSTPDCAAFISFDLTVNPSPVILAPTSLTVCDDNVSDGFTEMDLSLKDDEITGNNSNYLVSYYLSQMEAESGMNMLGTPYTNITNPQTVYVRVEDINTGCYITTTLVLQVEQAPSANIPTPLEYCDPDNDGYGEFSLTDAEAQITGGATGLTVSYHETLINAENNVIALSSPYSNIVINTQTLYARVVSTILTTDCATIVPLVLNVLPTPVVPVDIADYIICDTNDDGFTQFDLTTKNAEILSGQDPSQYELTYHTSQSNADTGTNPIVNVSNYTNVTNPQTIYVRLVGTNGCTKTGQFEIRVELPPTAIQPTPLNLCDDAVADEMTVFDLTNKDNEITGGNTSWLVSYYTTNADAQANTNVISPATAYTNMSVSGNPANPQTLYVRVTDTDTGCTDFTTLTIRVLPNPTPSRDPSDIELCDDINTGDGQEVFDLTTNEAYIINGEAGVIATYHEAMDDAEAGANAIVDPTMYTNTNTDNTLQTIYVRVANTTTGCYTIVSFNIKVDPLPAVVAVTDYILCEVNTDGFAQFDLTSKDAEVLNGQDPSQFTVSYHISQMGADNLTGALLSPYTNTTNPQRIYVAITNIMTGCSISTPSFNLEVDNGAQANSNQEAIEQVICDNIGDNEGLGQFDLTANDAEVLDGQDPANFIVTYYATEADAEFGVNPIPYLYENISNPQVIYVRVDNDTPDALGIDSSICYAVTELTLKVNLLPIFDLDDIYTLCVGTNGTEVIDPPVLDTGLSMLVYSFVWSLDGTQLPDETGSSLTSSQGGLYSVVVTNITTGCMNSDSADVVESSPPILEVEVTTQAFSENHVIVATASGVGEYEYSLDGGPWQSSGTFEDVSIGEHTVTARDIKGCGQASDTVMVLDYPHFFTPNGDGKNETWNIVGFVDQPSTKIYIFDRFGKLLKQISPSGQGWNGTYNGKLMPSSDYWFSVEYREPSSGEPKQFRAHFTLKR